MTPELSTWLLGAFGLSLILVTLSLWLLPGTPVGAPGYSAGARFFLIALRLAIGWHCFVEGMEKLTSPTWSSEAYLREASGPLAPYYRELGGDPLIDKLTVRDGQFPPALDRAWRNYVDHFAAYYDLDDAQVKRAHEILDKRKAATLVYLTAKKESVTKIAPYPPDLNVEMTMKQRLEEYQRLLDRVHEIEAKFPTTDKDVLAEWKTAKADAAKWRAGLKKSLAGQTNKLKSIDEGLKAKVQKDVAALTAKLSKTKDAAAKEKLESEISTEKAKLWAPLPEILTSEQRAEGPMPEPAHLPVAEWRILEWSDAIVMWSLIVLGGCLLLGFFSRCSAFAAGLLILSFYLAMPPLPGWPESPRLEGHYLIINKTLIEVLALFALACIPTGRWAGVDGFFALFCGCCGKKK